MSDPPIELVVFDLGRVLIRIVGDWRDAYQRAGVPIDDSFRTPQLMDEILSVFDQHQLGRIATGDFLERYAELSRLTIDQAEAVMAGWLCGPYADSMALIDELVDREVPTACLTNTNAHHWALMTAPDGPNALGLDRMDHLFASHLLRLAKPDEAIYRRVEQATRVRPASILFFDDQAQNVEAAQRRGWRAEVIENDGNPATRMRVHLQTYGVLSSMPMP